MNWPSPINQPLQYMLHRELWSIDSNHTNSITSNIVCYDHSPQYIYTPFDWLVKWSCFWFKNRFVWSAGPNLSLWLLLVTDTCFTHSYLLCLFNRPIICHHPLTGAPPPHCFTADVMSAAHWSPHAGAAAPSVMWQLAWPACRWAYVAKPLTS